MFLNVAAGAAIAALVFAILKYGGIMKQDAGDSKMQEISKQILEGAAAFLQAEYKWLTVFVIAVGAAIFFSGQQGLGQDTAIAFVAGVAASAVAGYFGMHTATRSAVRTTQAARTSLTRRDCWASGRPLSAPAMIIPAATASPCNHSP